MIHELRSVVEAKCCMICSVHGDTQCTCVYCVSSIDVLHDLFAETERKIRGNDSEYNNSFQYAVSSSFLFFKKLLGVSA